MLKIILLHTALIFSANIFSQVPTILDPEQDKTTTTYDDHDRIFTKVEIDAQFPGGPQGWLRFLEKNLHPIVPAENGAPAGKYVAVAQFVVNKDGSISDFRIISNPGYGIAQEVTKLMQLSPNWIPAKQNGRDVPSFRKQPFTFIVEEE